jgi:hypothetical protein
MLKRRPPKRPKATRKKPAATKRAKPAIKLGRRQLAWLKAAERVASIDARSFAGIVAYLRGASVQTKARYYYVDLRGARGVAKVEATLKGG